jgi:hypothetical protein
VFKGRHFDRSVILLRVRWYLAYGLSLRNLEEMMAERGVSYWCISQAWWSCPTSVETLFHKVSYAQRLLASSQQKGPGCPGPLLLLLQQS